MFLHISHVVFFYYRHRWRASVAAARLGHSQMKTRIRNLSAINTNLIFYNSNICWRCWGLLYHILYYKPNRRPRCDLGQSLWTCNWMIECACAAVLSRACVLRAWLPPALLIFYTHWQAMADRYLIGNTCRQIFACVRTREKPHTIRGKHVYSFRVLAPDSPPGQDSLSLLFHPNRSKPTATAMSKGPIVVAMCNFLTLRLFIVHRTSRFQWGGEFEGTIFVSYIFSFP